MKAVMDNIYTIHALKDMRENGVKKTKWYTIFCKRYGVKELEEVNQEITCKECLDEIKKRSDVEIPIDYISKKDQSEFCWNCNKDVPYIMKSVVIDNIEFETWIRVITKCLKCGWAIDDYDFEVG